MTKEILKDEMLTDSELVKISGGTYIDSMNVSNFLYQAGFDNVLNDKGFVNLAGMRSALNSIGIEATDHGGVAALGGKGNTYKVTSTGETLDQAGMMSYLREKYPNVRFKEMVEPKNIAEVIGMIK